MDGGQKNIAVKKAGEQVSQHVKGVRLKSTFSPMDTPPEVMMTSARLIPSWRADSKSSGLQTQCQITMKLLKSKLSIASEKNRGWPQLSKKLFVRLHGLNERSDSKTHKIWTKLMLPLHRGLCKRVKPFYINLVPYLSPTMPRLMVGYPCSWMVDSRVERLESRIFPGWRSSSGFNSYRHTHTHKHESLQTPELNTRPSNNSKTNYEADLPSHYGKHTVLAYRCFWVWSVPRFQ